MIAAIAMLCGTLGSVSGAAAHKHAMHELPVATSSAEADRERELERELDHMTLEPTHAPTAELTNGPTNPVQPGDFNGITGMDGLEDFIRLTNGGVTVQGPNDGVEKEPNGAPLDSLPLSDVAEDALVETVEAQPAPIADADQVGVDGNLLAEIMTRQTDLEEPDVVLDEDVPEATVTMGAATQPPTIDVMAMPTNEPTVANVPDTSTSTTFATLSPTMEPTTAQPTTTMTATTTNDSTLEGNGGTDTGLPETGAPTPLPTNAAPEPIKPTAKPTVATAPPTPEQVDTPPPDDTDGTRAQPVYLSEWIRINLKSVPEGGLMNRLQQVALEDVAQEFLSGMLAIAVPKIEEVTVEVTGQTILPNAGRKERMLRVGSAGNSRRRVQEDGQEEEELYRLQVDLRVNGQFDPQPPTFTTAEDVNFGSMCRNFFTVNGGAVVGTLQDMSRQAMSAEAEGVDGSGLEYFATVKEIRGVTPPAIGADGAGPLSTGGNNPQPSNEEGSGDNGNQLAYLIAIIVGSVAFVGLVGTMFYIVRKNRKKSSGFDRKSRTADSNGHVNGSSKDTFSPNKKSKKSAAALSVLTDEERISRMPAGPIDSPEEAQSEVGSLARIHMLDADDYSYSLEEGVKTPSETPKSLGPLFKARSNDGGMSPNMTYVNDLYGKNDFDNESFNACDESDFGDAADDATFSDFGKALSQSYSQGGGSKKASPSGESLSSAPSWSAPAIAEEEEVPEEKPRKAKKKKTFGASARKKKSFGGSSTKADTGGEWSADDISAASSASGKKKKKKNSNLGDLSIDGSASNERGAQDQASPNADAWLYETITDVLGPGDDQSAKSGTVNGAAAAAAAAPVAAANASAEGKSSSKFPGKKSKSKKKKSSRSMLSPMSVPENSIPEPQPIPEPMEYTPGGDDKSVMTTVTKLEDAGMVKREVYAPPGKLGVVIDSTSKGPVVHDVKVGSPLEGIVFPGDRIIAIDGEDTRTLPAVMVTKIMAAKKDQQRRMTVLSVMTGIS